MKLISLAASEVVTIDAICWQGARSIDHALPSFTPGDYSQWREMQEYLGREARHHVKDVLSALKMTKDTPYELPVKKGRLYDKPLRLKAMSTRLLRVINSLRSKTGRYVFDYQGASYVYHCVDKFAEVIDGKLLTNDEAVDLRMSLTCCLDVTYSRIGSMATDQKVMQIINYGMLTEVGFYRLDEILASKG
jgi:hypothetical protein